MYCVLHDILVLNGSAVIHEHSFVIERIRLYLSYICRPFGYLNLGVSIPIRTITSHRKGPCISPSTSHSPQL